MYLVNESNPAAISLAKKMSEHKHKQDGIINCTPEEIACINSGDFTPFNLTHEGSPLQKVEAGGSYILFADHGTSVDDAFEAAALLGINLGIVRTNESKAWALNGDGSITQLNVTASELSKAHGIESGTILADVIDIKGDK